MNGVFSFDFDNLSVQKYAAKKFLEETIWF